MTITNSSHYPFSNLQKALGPKSGQMPLFSNPEKTSADKSGETGKDEYIPASESQKAGAQKTANKRQSVDLGSIFQKNTTQTAGAVADMLSESYSQLQRRLLEDKITKELNHIGITLGTEDYLSFKIDAEGQIYVQDKYSHLEGRDVQKASGAIENALNESQYEGEPLGEALLKNFAQEQGIDLEQARQDDSFSVSFTFRYNAQTGRHEIGNVSFSSENKVQDSLIQNLFEELIESRENADEEKQNGPKETA